jgi:hypothetical protein
MSVLPFSILLNAALDIPNFVQAGFVYDFL